MSRNHILSWLVRAPRAGRVHSLALRRAGQAIRRCRVLETALLAIALVLAIGLPASAQNMHDMQLFAPADLSTYDCEPCHYSPNVGYFFSFDWLGWSIPAPNTAQIGFPNLTREVFSSTDNHWVDHNSHDTSMFDGQYKHGQRVEVGRVGPERCGWFFSTYRFDTMNQFDNATNMHVVLQDIAFGTPARQFLEGWVANYVGGTQGVGSYANFEVHELPVVFDYANMRNEVKTYSLELNALRRFRPFHNGGNLELFAGARYLQFDNNFEVFASGDDRFQFLEGPSTGDAVTGTPIGTRNVLADSDWRTRVQNHVVGPQIGARWFKKNNRWTASAEGRFFAGANQQRFHQRGSLGSRLDDAYPGVFDEGDLLGLGLPYIPRNLQRTAFEHRASALEWSPGVELRFQLSYQVTKALSLRVGWTGFWVDGIAWASRVIDYTLAEDQFFGINTEANRDSVFTHGLNVGVEFNR